MMMNEAQKFDTEKVRLDLLPVIPLIGVGRVLTYGAKKYSERNWEKGLDWSRCYGAALRHLFAWWGGETNDPETGYNHLDHALCELMFLREFAETHPELDDRPNNFTFSELLAKAKERDAVKPAEVPSPSPERRTWTELVKEFNETFDNFIKRESGTLPSLTWYDSIKTQLRLIYEEIDELGIAYKQWDCGETDDEIPILDAICDSIYVLIGLALKMGFNLDGAFHEVHRSNMSKLGPDGKPIKRADGKILKGPNFTPPNLEPYI